MNGFRLLRADEIEARVSTINEKGLTLLLYKDARVDQNILDEAVGCMNWQRRHELIDGQLFCNVGILNTETGQWIWKQDVGTESYTEKEKGRASDSFKRACFNWGIGRELYTAPFIWISAGNYKAYDKDGKKTTYDRFSVSAIDYNEAGQIIYLRIRNDKLERDIYEYKPKIDRAKIEADAKARAEAARKANEELAQPINESKYTNLLGCCEKHGIPEEEMAKAYGTETLREWTNANFKRFQETGEEFLRKWDEEHAES